MDSPEPNLPHNSGEIMKTTAILAAFFAGSLALLSATAQAGATLNRVMKTGTMVEVTDESYPPFSFLDQNNEMAGFDIDVAKQIAKRLGVKMKVDTPSWEVITAGHWNGRYDVCVCSMTPTKQRAQVLNFPVFYYGSPATIVVNKDDNRIKSAADLSGKKVGVEAGTTYERYLDKKLVIDIPGSQPVTFKYPFHDVQVVPYQSETQAFQDLALGPGRRLDAMVTNYLTARARIKKEGKFKTVGGALFEEPIYIATDKGDKAWDAKITSIIHAMQRDGTLKKISMKWIGIDITKKP